MIASRRILLTLAAAALSATHSPSLASGCDGYPLQSRGSAPNGYICRCTYDANGIEGWWAVIPGSGAQAPIRCAPPQDRGAPPAFTVQDEQEQHNQRVNAWREIQQRRQIESEEQQRTQAERRQQQIQSNYLASRPDARSRPPAQLSQPSHSHRAIVEKDHDHTTVSGSPSKTYWVEVTNTGNVPLECSFKVTGNQSVHGGGRCIDASSCVANRTSSGMKIIPVNSRSRVAGLTYYMGRGGYSGGCRAYRN